MKENVIIQGEFNKQNTIAFISFICAALSFIISYIIYPVELLDYLVTALIFDCPEGVGVFFYLGTIALIVGIVTWFQMSFCELTVTDKRVYGKAAFGKLIDLPYDQISSVGTCFPRGVFAATSSGMVKFWLLTNQRDVYKAISTLLMERQNNTPVNAAINNNADELKKYKELFDQGVITQEEFDAKKKQLLGL